jgi:hypothetical protein
MQLRWVLLAFGLFAFFMGWGAMADEVSDFEMKDIRFYAEDSVKGDGMFARYNYLGPFGPHYDSRIPSVDAVTSVKKTEHGSGTMENEQISRMERVNRWIELDWDWRGTGMHSLASIDESNSMKFSPVIVTVGLGFYARNPVVFSSLLSEETIAKNYAMETSMVHATNRAKSINKDLNASVTDSHYDLDGWTIYDAASVGLNVREDVVDGATSIGVLQGNTLESSHSAWMKPVIDIDQSYLGTYTIDTKMRLDWPIEQERAADAWLPCCQDGWKDMNPLDQKPLASAKGIFDCTCYKI